MSPAASASIANTHAPVIDPVAPARGLIESRAAECVEDLERVKVPVLELLDVCLLGVQVDAHLRPSVRAGDVEVDVSDGLRCRPVDLAVQVQLAHQIEGLLGSCVTPAGVLISGSYETSCRS